MLPLNRTPRRGIRQRVQRQPFVLPELALLVRLSGEFSSARERAPRSRRPGDFCHVAVCEGAVCGYGGKLGVGAVGLLDEHSEDVGAECGACGVEFSAFEWGCVGVVLVAVGDSQYVEVCFDATCIAVEHDPGAVCIS